MLWLLGVCVVVAIIDLFIKNKNENEKKKKAVLNEARWLHTATETNKKESKARRLLTEAETISQSNICLAREKLEQVKSLLTEISNYDLQAQYDSLNHRVSILEDEQRRERQKKKEELARKQKEQEQLEQKRKEEKARKEREAAIRYYRTSFTKNVDIEPRKANWQDYLDLLNDNGIEYLYHFTDKRNLSSIRRHGGLYSWAYCERNNIAIPNQGGDDFSRSLDRRYGLQDYVRLSFCEDHPMAYRLKQSGADIVVLKISTDVALLKDTLYSDINAADSAHTHGGSLAHLRMVNFDAVKRTYVSKDDPDFKPHQAEVMVKTFVPLKYILNI